MGLLIEVIKEVGECLGVRHEGVLLVSKAIDSKVGSMAVLLLMLRFGWGIERALGFIRGKREGLGIREKYLRVLRGVEKR